MGVSFSNMSNMQIDVFKELASIGCGNAVTSLSKMLKKKVGMSVPMVNLLDFKNVSDFIGGPENIIIGVLVNLSHDIDGIMMFLIDMKCAHSLISMMIGRQLSENSEFSELELSALQEIGNILCSSYLSSLSSMTNQRIIPSVPQLSIDMAGAILSVPAIEFGKVSDKVLFIESTFSTDQENVSGFFVLVPDPPSFAKILSSLGVS